MLYVQSMSKQVGKREYERLLREAAARYEYVCQKEWDRQVEALVQETGRDENDIVSDFGALT